MKVYDFPQYSPEWWQVRRSLPTSSRFGSIITPKTGQLSKQCHLYACELVAQLYDPDYGVVEDYQSAAMKNGSAMEPEARKYYELERDATAKQVGFCLHDSGRFGGSPDALVGDDGCLELKSPTYKTQVAYLIGGELPAEYKPQCHGHLLVTGRKWCDFMSYCPGLPPLLVRVEPDEFTKALGEAVEQFCDLLDEYKAKFDDPDQVSEEAEAAAVESMF